MSARRLSLAVAAVAALAVGLGAAPGLADTGSHGAQVGSHAVAEWNATALRTTAAAAFDPPLELSRLKADRSHARSVRMRRARNIPKIA